MPIGTEARCTSCGESFVLSGPDDDPETLIHHFKYDETECGGQGEIVGTWGR